jgi:hypothetical protein
MSVITIKKSAIGQERNKKSRRSFRELSRRYFASEKKFEFIIELLLFVILVAISAWPILAAADALNRLLQTPTT